MKKRFYAGGSGLDRIQFHRIRTGLGLKNFTVRSSLPQTTVVQHTSVDDVLGRLLLAH